MVSVSSPVPVIVGIFALVFLECSVKALMGIGDNFGSYKMP